MPGKPASKMPAGGEKPAIANGKAQSLGAPEVRSLEAGGPPRATAVAAGGGWRKPRGWRANRQCVFGP
eukprot:1657353-Lingulodinium_polyedra.AAC.1